MKLIRLFLPVGLLLALTATAFSQTMFNTGSKITLVNTCINAGMTTGTYNLELYYLDRGTGNHTTVSLTGVAVTVSPTVMTITGPANSFPSPSNNGYWSLPDTKDGHIMLTSAGHSAIIYWVQKPNDSLAFSCVALPIYFSNFSGYLNSSKQVVLSWQTDMEQNSTYIEIYRYSGGSGGYYKIGQVAAAGNSGIPVNYSFIDAYPCTSNTYYLKMLNSQGTEPITYGYASVGCSSCSCSLPSPVYCNFSINGPDLLCSAGSFGAYSLSSPVPSYSTITWSVDQPSAASLTTYPDWDPTAAGVLTTGTTAFVNITATLSGCTNAISKTIALGAPASDIFVDVECPNLVCMPLGAVGATSYDWTLYNYTNPGVSYGSGSEFDPYIGDGSDYQVSLSYTNACGTSPTTQVGTFHCDPGTSTRTGGSTATGNPGNLAPTPGSVVWPNPTNGLVSVALPVTVGASVQPRIYIVKVMDAQGIARKTFNYPGGINKASVNISELAAGVYILQIFDKQQWVTRQVVLVK